MRATADYTAYRLAGGDLLKFTGKRFLGKRVTGIRDVPVDVALRWIEIEEAVRRIDQLEQRLLLLPLSLNARAGDDERIREQITRIKLDTGLGQPFDREFASFFRNWKARLAEAEDLADRRAALKWILRRLRTAVDIQPTS